MLGLGMRAAISLAFLSLAQGQSNFTNSTTSSSTSFTTSFVSSSTSLPSSISLNATTTAAGNGSAEVCNNAQISWSVASVSYSSAHRYPVTDTTTRNYTSTVSSTKLYNVTMTCGTISYAGPTTDIISTTAITETGTITYTTGSEYPSPSPNCSIGTSDCLSLKTSYSSASSSWWDLSSNQRTLTPSPVQPSCSACIATGCTIAHAGASVYYWPITTNVSRDYCASGPTGGVVTTGLPNPDSTYVETTTGPYAVVNGSTLYSGNVYLSMVGLFATDNCGNILTRKSPQNSIITMASSDLYSVRGYPHNVLPWSVNFADFIEPVPWSAYAGGWYCANNRPICSEVFPHDYYPVFSMPGQIRLLDPAYASCSFDQFGIFDPPYALHSVGNIFASSTVASAAPTPTDPDPVVTGTPDPGQSPSDGSPTATGSPSTPTDPSDPSDPNDPSDPSDPQDPEPSANPSDPQDPASSNDPQPNDPQDPASSGGANPAPGQPATNPAANPTSPGNNSPGNSPGDPTTPVITVGPTVVPVDPTTGVVINPGTTLTSGGAPVVISSTTFSIGTGGLTIISPSTSSVIPIGSSPTTVSIAPGNTISIDPAGTVVLPGTTLAPGGAPITVDGTTLSMGTSGIVVIGPGGTTSTIAFSGSSPQVISVGSETFTVTGGEVVLAPGTTLGFGDPAVTISGTTFSMGPSGLVVVSSGATSTVSVPMATQIVTIGGQAYTMYDGDLVLGPGTTIGVGDPAVTIDGTTFSVSPTGLVVLSSDGGTTVPITGTGTDVGPSGTATGPDSEQFTGAAGKMDWKKGLVMGVVIEVVVVLMV